MHFNCYSKYYIFSDLYLCLIIGEDAVVGRADVGYEEQAVAVGRIGDEE